MTFTRTSSRRPRRWQRFGALLGLLFLLPGAQALAAKDPVYTSLFSNTALKGYDAVAYFKDDKPVKGSKQFAYSWNGADWHFSSAENRDAFAADPDRFAPQYGGYCAWAVSQGYTASGDPTVWTIVDDKLYVNYNDDVGKKWRADPQGFIAKANQNWPNVLN
ncbi:MAG: YHS domain-containing (seleno)protein [Pseudomonadota bacterium]